MSSRWGVISTSYSSRARAFQRRLARAQFSSTEQRPYPRHLLRVSALGDARAQATRFEAGAAQGPPGELLMSKLPLPGGCPPEAVFGFEEVGPPPNPSARAPEMDPDLTRLEPALIAPRRGPSDARERPIIGIRLSGKNGSFECSLGCSEWAEGPPHRSASRARRCPVSMRLS